MKQLSSFIKALMLICLICPMFGVNCRADDAAASSAPEIPLVQEGCNYFIRPVEGRADGENAYVIMLPVEAVIGEYADISWSDGGAHIRCGTLDVFLKIGETDYVINGEQASFDAPPEIINGMTCIPATFFERTFGFWINEAGEGAIDLFMPDFIIENI